eukprot:738442-Amphidinium_carterae.2
MLRTSEFLEGGGAVVSSGVLGRGGGGQPGSALAVTWSLHTLKVERATRRRRKGWEWFAADLKCVPRW